MLAPWIIEELRKEKEERERVDHRIWLPLPTYESTPKPKPVEPEMSRGVTVIEL